MTEVMVLCCHAVSPTGEARLSVTQISARAAPHPRVLAVTFDDAFASVHPYADPILASLGPIARPQSPARDVHDTEAEGSWW
jgi:hypothetical protein